MDLVFDFGHFYGSDRGRPLDRYEFKFSLFFTNCPPKTPEYLQLYLARIDRRGSNISVFAKIQFRFGRIHTLITPSAQDRFRNVVLCFYELASDTAEKLLAHFGLFRNSWWLAKRPVRYPKGLMRSANDVNNHNRVCVCAPEGARKPGRIRRKGGR